MRITTKILAALTFFSVTAASSAFGFELEGEWTRVDDYLDGTKVKVYKLYDNTYQSEIIYAPANPLHFSAGDIKWMKVTNIAQGKYNLYDLVKHKDKNKAPYYIKKYLIVINDKTIHLRDFAGSNLKGTAQKWIKHINTATPRSSK